MTEPLLIYTTWPDEESARAFADEAVQAGLAACANIGAPITSVYRWGGAIEEARETPMWLKTTRSAAAELRRRFVERHPYETPAYVALGLEAQASLAPYLAWLTAETQAPAGAEAGPGDPP